MAALALTAACLVALAVPIVLVDAFLRAGKPARSGQAGYGAGLVVGASTKSAGKAAQVAAQEMAHDNVTTALRPDSPEEKELAQIQAKIDQLVKRSDALLSDAHEETHILDRPATPPAAESPDITDRRRSSGGDSSSMFGGSGMGSTSQTLAANIAGDTSQIGVGGQQQRSGQPEQKPLDGGLNFNNIGSLQQGTAFSEQKTPDGGFNFNNGDGQGNPVSLPNGQGPASLAKTGTGMLSLTVANSYSGGTTVGANATLNNTDSVVFSDLAGTGTNTVTWNQGDVTPANLPGIVPLTVASGGTLQVGSVGEGETESGRLMFGVSPNSDAGLVGPIARNEEAKSKVDAEKKPSPPTPPKPPKPGSRPTSSPTRPA